MDEDARERRRRILEMELPPRFCRRLSGVLIFPVLFAFTAAFAWGLLK